MLRDAERKIVKTAGNLLAWIIVAWLVVTYIAGKV